MPAVPAATARMPMPRPATASPSPTFRALSVRALLVLLLLSLAGTAFAGKKRDLLDRNQYAYSAAIRWGDFEGAWNMVDPKIRKEKPMTDVDFSRYEQVQITAYRDLATMPGPDDSELREIQIEVVNRNTLTQRSVRYTEVWRFDPVTKNWWVAGLPDFWKGL
jgi:hypothetical protein